MSVNDRCRLCSENLRIKGYIGNSKKIFHKDANERSIDERLTELGLKLSDVPQRPCRICLRCFRLIARLEDAMSTFRRWQQAEEEPVSELPSSSESEKVCVTLKRDWVPTPSKLCPRPPTPPAPPAPKLRRPTSDTRARQSVTEVVVYYPSKPKGERITCQDHTAGIVEAIARSNWSGAAKQIARHKDLIGPINENILDIIEDECKKICSPFSDFMLSKSSPEDLKSFSFEKLQTDLQRVSPFLFSVFLCITKQSANIACAAAAVALRGREPRLSAFAYYVNSVLQYAGVKKAAFKRLCKLGITTSYSNSVKKQTELANTCVEDFQVLRVATEILLKEHEDTSTANGGSAPASENKDAEGATTSSTPDVVRDLDGTNQAMHGMRQFVLSDLQLLMGSKEEDPPEQQVWSSSLDQEDPPEPPHIKEEQEELWTNQEGEQLHDVIKFRFSPVPVKSEEEEEEEEEEKPELSQLHQTQTEEMKTEADGEDCEEPGPEPEPGPDRTSDPDHHLTPEPDEKTKDSFEPETEDSDVCKRSREPQSASNFKKTKVKRKLKLFSCPECGKRFSYVSKLKTHMVIHSGEKPFSCSVCRRSFTRRAHMTNHMTLHTGEKKYSCSVCGKGFNWHHQLKGHQSSQHRQSPAEEDGGAEHLETEAGGADGGGPRAAGLQPGVKPFSCSICGKRYQWKNSLRTHMRRHSAGKCFSCSICKKTFPWRGDVVRHMRIHTGEKPFSCSVCGAGFTESSNLTAHSRLHTGEKPFGCSVCAASFRQKSSLSTHMRLHTGEKPFSCSVCGMTFKHKTTLTNHMVLHTGEKPFSCSVCRKHFTQKVTLTKHMAYHTAEKRHICSDCGKRFIWLYKLKRHQSSQQHRSKTTESREAQHERTDRGGPQPARTSDPDQSEPETDDSCDWEKTSEPRSASNSLQNNQTPEGDSKGPSGKTSGGSAQRASSFNHEKHLEEPSGTQTREKPFSCSVCGQRYFYKKTLKNHMTVHTDHEGFSCSVCQKTFRWKVNLVRHMKVHSQREGFSCSVCQKTFQWRVNLVRHMRGHTGEKPFACSVCGKRFAVGHYLTAHLRIHTGEKPHKCSVCETGFREKSYLSKHMRTHEGGTG